VLGTSAPAWSAHPDVWLLVAVLVAGYATAALRLGPRLAPRGQPAVSRFQVTCFVLAIAATWLVSDWPIHDVAEQRMFSVHMAQHLVFSMVATPLLLLATPAWLARWVLQPGSRRFAVVRTLSRFLPAILIFNLVLVITHWPAVVNEAVGSGVFHFLVHAVLFVSSLVVWMPVLSPLPEIPRLAALPRMVYLFSQSVVPTVPASFLTFGGEPLYRVYDRLPHLWGMTTLEDQQIAGLLMMIAAGTMLWMIIAALFFRWAADEERRQQPGIRRALDRELAEMRPETSSTYRVGPT
jgi:putative membrane protein